jgi:hypothetical protein
VLRIQRTEQGDTVVLTLSGALADQYLAELERVVAAETGALALELGGLTRVSRDAVKRLAVLEAAGTRLLGTPEYLRQWISKERD